MNVGYDFSIGLIKLVYCHNSRSKSDHINKGEIRQFKEELKFVFYHCFRLIERTL